MVMHRGSELSYLRPPPQPNDATTESQRPLITYLCDPTTATVLLPPRPLPRFGGTLDDFKKASKLHDKVSAATRVEVSVESFSCSPLRMLSSR